MELLSIKNVSWANVDHSTLCGVAVVEVDDGSETDWPFAVRDNYDTPLGQEIWDRVNSGEFGPIGEYTEPEQPEPLVPDEISRRQFFQQLSVMEIITKEQAKVALQGGIIPEPLQDIVDALPTEDDRFQAEMLIIGASSFNRQHPLAETVRLSLGWSEAQKDDFWRDAYNL